ncbi:MAG: tyrosine-type recombinase/integrase [Lachnospiraceae bacterium]
MCLEASLPLISMHGLRHEFASLLFEKGIPLEQISKLLGHKSVTTTFDVYCGIIDADSDAKEIIKTFAPYIKKGVNYVDDSASAGKTIFLLRFYRFVSIPWGCIER